MDPYCLSRISPVFASLDLLFPQSLSHQRIPCRLEGSTVVRNAIEAYSLPEGLFPIWKGKESLILRGETVDPYCLSGISLC